MQTSMEWATRETLLTLPATGSISMGTPNLAAA